MLKTIFEIPKPIRMKGEMVYNFGISDLESYWLQDPTTQNTAKIT